MKYNFISLLILFGPPCLAAKVFDKNKLEALNNCWDTFKNTGLYGEKADAMDFQAIWLRAIPKVNTTYMLKCLKELNIPGSDYVDPIDNENIWLKAVKIGQIEVVRWLKKNNMPGLDYALKQKGFDSLWSGPAHSGNIEMLEWLKENIVPRGQNLADLVYDSYPAIWLEMARANQVAVLQWLLDNDIPGSDQRNEIGNIWMNATRHPEVLDLLKKNNVAGSNELHKNIEKIIKENHRHGEKDLDWLFNNNFVDVSSFLKIIPDPYKTYMQEKRDEEDEDYADIKLIETLLKHKVPGVEYVDKDGNNIWLDGYRTFHTYSYSHIDLVHLFRLLARYKVPGILQVNNEGMNIWLSAVQSGLPKALDWLRDQGIPGRDNKDKQGKNIWSYLDKLRQKAPWGFEDNALWLVDNKVPGAKSPLARDLVRTAQEELKRIDEWKRERQIWQWPPAGDKRWKTAKKK